VGWIALSGIWERLGRWKTMENFWESHETCDSVTRSSNLRLSDVFSHICSHGMWILNCGQPWQF
jgi:hypothetical protein